MKINDIYLMPAAERAGVTDPVLLESGTEVFSAMVENRYDFSFRVCGELSIVWKGVMYNDPSLFPEGLKKVIRKKGLNAVGAKDDSDVLLNPWSELFVYDHTLPDGEDCIYDEVLDIDISSLTEEDVKEIVNNVMKGIVGE